VTRDHGTSVRSIATSIQNGDRRAVDVLDEQLDRIATVDPRLGAFCETFTERARDQAAKIDRRREAGEDLGALAGVPIATKDNLLVQGEIITAGSRILSSFEAPFTAASVARIEQRGAVLLGRTNMDEFGMGSTTETSSHQQTRNPYGDDLVPGGSSGGSAAAVAADLCPLAIGSDTGGSIRQPAALCGVTGLKPTYGRVPRYGLIAYASSLDCVGAIARTADDLAVWLDCVSGPHKGDATSIAALPPTRSTLADRADLRGVRIGVPRELNGPGIDEQILARTEEAIAQLREIGAEVHEATLPSVTHAVPAYYLIATSEAASNLARYDGVHYGWRGDPASKTQAAMTTQTRSSGFGEEVQLRILLGTFATSIGFNAKFYEKAQLARRAVQHDFDRAFADCDVLVCPTSPTAAPRFGESADDPLERYLWDALTVPASLAGLPALSTPCGQTDDGRPVGLQVIAPRGHDDRTLMVAHVLQRHTDHHLRRPQL